MRAFPRRLFLTLMLIGALFGRLDVVADPVNYTGHYEPAETQADQVFALDLTQTGSAVEVSFSASMTDGSGAAPDADGKGTVQPDGTLTFTFKDSFDNAGTGSLVPGKDGFLLHLNTTTVADPRPLRFYGDIPLKKTSDKPSSS